MRVLPSTATAMRAVWRLERSSETRDIEHFAAVQGQRAARVARCELQRQHTGCDQVGAMNALE